MVEVRVRGLQVIEVTPQQVKGATGFGGGAAKPTVRRAMSRLLNVELSNLHVADAAACAIAGVLHIQKEVF